jgi:hypothetical protein
LRELYRDRPIINFEHLSAHDPLSDMDWRKTGVEAAEMNYLRSYCRNAMIPLDFRTAMGRIRRRVSKSRFPAGITQARRDFDGVDRGFYTATMTRYGRAPKRVTHHRGRGCAAGDADRHLCLAWV